MPMNIIKYIIRFVPAFISALIALVSVFSVNPKMLEEEIAGQLQRISELESAYASGEIAPVNEADFFNGDLKAELENGIKFNEMRFLATHNSYQTPNTRATKKLFSALSDITFGLVNSEITEFFSPTLTEQLNLGIRSLEIDIEVFDRKGEISFTCMHSPYFEMTTSCYDFALAMKEIAMWSDNNPDHLPITIIIEPKETFLPMKNMKALDISYTDDFEKVLYETLGDKLFTPSDMLRDYASFGEMRAADDWCKVRDMLGKVIILLHECETTEDYISLDPTIKTQAMFPMLREKDIDRDCTAFILANMPDVLLKNNEKIIYEKKIVARTRADKFTEITTDRLENAMKSGAQIVSTDYPYTNDMKPDDYFVSFENRKTIEINK